MNEELIFCCVTMRRGKFVLDLRVLSPWDESKNMTKTADVKGRDGK